MASMARDDSAADSIPVALAATVLIMAIIAGLAAFGVRNATPAVQLANVDIQVDAMANDCRYLLSLAPRNLDDPCSPPGACRIVELDLPGGLEYLSFGYDPDTEGGHRGTIYYKVSGTKKAIVVDECARYRAAYDDHMILRPGTYSIIIEYASDTLGRRYLLLSTS